MASVACGQCKRTLEFSGDPPAFCAYCGVRLDSASAASTPTPNGATVAYEGTVTATPDGAPAAATPPPAAIGGYRLVRALGSGGMGTVYEAEGQASGQRVAVKLLAAPFAGQSTALERFRQEGRLASLIAHPRCVFVLAADEEAGRPYIVMELMPGGTLRDLVERRGPLPPQEAIAKILDVIDGLREAHRLGILHRDVKPSNCFLMPDGRVKVGDFGLSKSLAGDAQLTQTGAFLGTVLYASPEQVRGEGIDYASDVYSVCATLYFLLTGRAPFQHEHAGAVLAKVVSEDPPPVRRRRPDVSRRLERVVLKGLERDKAKRWQTLDELQAALRALVPGTMTRGSLGLRFAAYMIDRAVLFVPWALGMLGAEALLGESSGAAAWLWIGTELPYFALLEGTLGYSPGKFCLRLRVCPPGGTEPPPWPRLLLRTAVFVLAVHSLALADDVLNAPLPVAFLLWLTAVIALVAPMRGRNGYRGLHELISDTRVVQLPWALRRRTLRPVRARYAPRSLGAGQYPAEVGGYRLRGLIHADDREAVLLADDPFLGREVHLWLRPADAPPLSAARRSLSRPTRPRWLEGCEIDGRRWDAFYAPPGSPIADLVTPQEPLRWSEARTILEQLTEELRDARADGTLPPTIHQDQVWVLPDGRVQLLDFALQPRLGWVPDDAGALELLRETAVLALEGAPRPPGAPPAPVHAPVPPHAARLLDRLLGGREPFTTLDQVHDALRETHERLTETTRPARAAHVGVQALVLALGVVWMFAVSGLFGVTELWPRWVEARIGERALAVYRDRAAAGDDLRSVIRQYDADGRLGERLERYLAERRAALERQLHYSNLAERIVLHVWTNFVPPNQPAISPATLAEVAAQAAREDPGGPVRSAAPHRRRSTTRGFHLETRPDFVPAAAVIALWPAVWVVWSFLSRGGLTLSLMGLALVRGDGRRAARWQCAGRALLVWAPVVAPLLLCVWVKVYAPWLRLIHSGLWWLAVAVLVGEVVVAIQRPRHAPHDRLLGTYVVPL